MVVFCWFSVVDWLEESPSLSPALYDKATFEEEGNAGRESAGDGPFLESVTAPGVVSLDGCILTPKQKEHLDELRQSSSIGSWCVFSQSKRALLVSLLAPHLLFICNQSNKFVSFD